jgi:hypothetical protein
MSGELLEALCRRMGDDNDPVRSLPAVRHLADRIVERLRSGVDADGLTDDLEELNDRLLQAGYAAGLGSHRAYRPLPGGGHPVLEVLACPTGRCARVELPRTEAACALSGRPMAASRLRS